MDKVILVKINQVIGYLYLPPSKTRSAVIYAKGGPSMGDSGESPLWPLVKSYNKILFFPDYIGYCHSAGQFNFQNCINTFHESEQFLSGQITGIDTFSGEKIELNCDDILLIGSSWGGSMVPFLEKDKKSNIKNIALIKPVTDWTTQGKTNVPEENLEETDRMIMNGWLNFYRGYEKSEWPKIFSGELKEFNPIDNIALLKDKNVFICHGEKDNVINVKKSKTYFQKFKEQFPQANVQLKIFPNLDHSSEMNYAGLEYILKELPKI